MNYITYVNTKQGSHSSRRFSAGSTLPFTQLPFAMAGFVPQTNTGNQTWFFHPDDHCLEGVRLSHQPSPWIGEYGSLTFLPQTGDAPESNYERRWSSYRPGEAVLRPDYLKLNFMRYHAAFELTPTERGGVLRLNYGDITRKAYLSVLP